LPQCDRVIVVEDGTCLLDPGSPPVAGVEVIRLDENRGIAAALNTGIRAALAAGDDPLILTMDQDSVICEGYVRRGVEEIETARSHGIRVGAVGAESHNGQPMRLMKTSIAGHRLLFDPMQSGTLYPSATFAHIGLLQEDLVIDAVDMEFNLRMLASGLAQIAIPGGDLHHELGETRPLRLLGWNPKLHGRPLRIHYHSPYRTYFIVRNNVILWRQYARTFPRWIARRAVLEVESAVVCLVYGPRRRQHLVAMVAGVRDARAKRLGSMTAMLRSRLTR
jgi:rhamnosyltransferase